MQGATDQLTEAAPPSRPQGATQVSTLALLAQPDPPLVTPGPAHSASSRQGDEFQRPGILQNDDHNLDGEGQQKARTGLGKAAAAIANMPQAGRLITPLPLNDTDPAK